MPNKRVKKIALTGGIGSGKSLALRIISELGYYTISCDFIVKKLYKKRRFLKKIKNLFPNAVTGKLFLKADKKIISDEVFNNDDKLKSLNELTHGEVLKIALQRADKKGKKKKVAFIEVPLLFESNLQVFFDETIVIKRDLEERIKSVLLRSSLTRVEIKDRINAQIDYESFDFSKCLVIINNGVKSDFKSQIISAVKEITKE